MGITAYGKSFDFSVFMKDLEQAYQSYQNVPLITLMSIQGSDPYRILIATILSARTKDETTAPAADRLFKKAPTAKHLAQLDIQIIEQLIFPVGFYKTKAKNIQQTATQLVEKYQSKVPQDIEELVTLPGVGRKTANLVLGEAFKKPAVCVDTHVHKISNRLGILNSKTPEQTEMILRELLPQKYWITYNTYLVAHGQKICRPISPWCSLCQLKKHCKRKGVTTSR